MGRWLPVLVLVKTQTKLPVATLRKEQTQRSAGKGQKNTLSKAVEWTRPGVLNRPRSRKLFLA